MTSIEGGEIVRKRKRGSLSALLFLLLVVGVVLAAAADDARLILGFPVAVAALIVVHELGHLATALACRWRVFAVQFGSGRAFLSRRVRRVNVRLGANPFGGRVVALPRSARWLRVQIMVVTLSGVAAALLVVVVAVLALPTSVAVAVVAAGALQLLELIPVRLGPAGAAPETDGLRFLSAAFGRGSFDTVGFFSALQALAETEPDDRHQAQAIVDEYGKRHPRRADLTWYLGVVRRARAEGTLRLHGDDAEHLRVFAEKAWPTPLRKTAVDLANTFVYSELVAGRSPDPAVVHVLEHHLVDTPDNVAIVDSLAWARVDQGRAEESLALSRRAVGAHLTNPAHEAGCRAVLGLGLVATGDLVGAEAERQAVVALDATCVVLPHLDRALARARVDASTEAAEPVER